MGDGASLLVSHLVQVHLAGQHLLSCDDQDFFSSRAEVTFRSNSEGMCKAVNVRSERGVLN